ncbi:MAG: hypothetical protein ABEL04_02660 [Salinibacter sp.]|uniref:hypothetical protein n=1 Tax=Salinibacter sp. TaxID=2065818 RepID=UPI0035D3E48F
MLRSFCTTALALLLLAAGLGACDALESAPSDRVVVGDTTETMKIVGTLQYVEVEGGCWSLRADTASYMPLGVPPSFRSDGIEVQVRAVRRPDVMCICMTGTPIEVRSINRR